MIDRTNCSGKFEVLYKELEKRSNELITSESELRSYGCSISDNPHILDCVIGLDDHCDGTGRITAEKHRHYTPYHFAIKRSCNKVGKKESVLISADWLEDMVNYWKKNYQSIFPTEHMIIAMLYEDFYYLFNVSYLVKNYGFGSTKFYSKYVKNIPCYNHDSKMKEPNRVMLLPINWAEGHGYLCEKSERDAIYGADKARKNKQVQSTVDSFTNISSLI